MYCHIHSCHIHQCKCESYNKPTDPDTILTQEQLVEATNEFKKELLNYSLDLKANIFDYVDTGLNPVEVANNFDKLKAQDTYIIKSLTKKIDELNNSTGLSLFNIYNSIKDITDEIKQTKLDLDTLTELTGAIPPTSELAVVGSIADGTALKSLLTALSEYGLISDNTID